MTVKLKKKAQEQGTYIIRYSFLDENEDPAVPNDIAWSLVKSPGVIVNERDSVDLTPDTTVTIVLYGDDLALTADDARIRRVTLAGTYDSTLGEGLPYTDELVFEIEDLMGVAAVT